MAAAEIGAMANLRSGSAPSWAFPRTLTFHLGLCIPVSLVAPAFDRNTLRVDCVNSLHSTPAPFENQWQPGRGVQANLTGTAVHDWLKRKSSKSIRDRTYNGTNQKRSDYQTH
jgi:hypothetical protein